jgi:sec-independent protein translocase protein TatC
MADGDTAPEASLPALIPAGSAGGQSGSGAGESGGTPMSSSSPASPLEDTAMSLVDHLGELRNRLVKTAIAIVALGAIGFIRAGAIIDVLRGPIGVRPLITLSPGGLFFLYVKIALVTGLILGMPVILYQLWAFIAPGLTADERRVIRPWVPIALLFFVIGVAVAWVVLPFALGFLFSFEQPGLQFALTVDNYFGFISTMFLAFGLTMQFPIVLYVLSRIGIVSSQRLSSSRRYVILGIAVFATVVTPGGDLVSPTVLGVTMYVLYEVSIIVIRRSGH